MFFDGYELYKCVNCVANIRIVYYCLSIRCVLGVRIVVCVRVIIL